MVKVSIKDGDCISLMKRIKKNSVNLVIADPPYNLQKNYKSTKDNLSFLNYIKFSKQWIKEACDVLKPGGTIYVFMGMKFISYIYLILSQEQHFNFQSWITWHYTQGVGRRKGFSSRHDDILMFTKPGNKYLFHLDSVRIPQKYYRKVNNMRGANPGNVWNFSHVHYSEKDRFSNPTQKPEGVIERMILASSSPGDLVLDPFSGSGTTARVAQQTKRNCLGIELEPSYVKESINRLKEPFKGFDSIDPRMLRVPRDLNNKDLREKYFHNHIKWFLKNHQSSIKNYLSNFWLMYNKKMTAKEIRDFSITMKHFTNIHCKYKKRKINKYKPITLF